MRTLNFLGEIKSKKSAVMMPVKRILTTEAPVKTPVKTPTETPSKPEKGPRVIPMPGPKNFIHAHSENFAMCKFLKSSNYETRKG